MFPIVDNYFPVVGRYDVSPEGYRSGEERMNTKTILSMGLGVLVVAGLVAGGAGSAFAASSASQTAVEGGQYRQETTQNATDGRSVNLSTLSVSALQAAQLAQNETGGKVLAVRLKTVNGTTGYEVLVTNEQGNVTGVVVNAEQPEVIETREDLARFNQTVLQQQGVNVSDVRGAVETIRAAQQTVGQEFVPIEVSVEAERGFVGQQITFVSPNATQQVVVDLTGDPVVGVTAPAPNQGGEADADGQRAETETTETGQATTTEAGQTTTTAAALAMGAGSANVAQDDDEATEGDDRFTSEFGDASEYVNPENDAFADDAFAANDEFDTADDYGLFTGGEEEEDGGLFGGEEEEEEGGAFLGEEEEDGWF